MRFLGFLLVLAVFYMGSVSQSHARKGFLWQKYSVSDFEPYLGDQKINNRALWDGDEWTPQDWLKEEGDAKRIIRDFYEAEIITDQYKDSDDIPVLEVGDAFINLSSSYRYRVLRFVDHIFEITSSEENGTFYVFYAGNDDEALGLYNKHGFQSY